MHRIESPTGAAIEIPATRAEDPDGVAPDDLDGIRRVYAARGYVVVRGLVAGAAAARVRAAFHRQVRPYDGFLYRQTTGNPERNRFDEHGFVANPILNVQDLPTREFAAYKAAALAVLTAASVQHVATAILGGPPKLVQSMHFDGNAATWAHQDTYYLDSVELGTMTAGWFALEEIRPGAGRFFVYPESHKIDVAKNGGTFDIAFNHARYKRLIFELIEKYDLECWAPYLDRGDVLFWNAKTIHGSLATNQPGFSRASLTAHYIRADHRFLQFQSREKRLSPATINGMLVHRPKNQDLARNRAVLWVETRFPRSFRLAKKLAIKAVTSS